MAWNASGDERGKSYRVYRELEAAYKDAKERLDSKDEEVSRLRDTIRGLALELARLGGENTAAEAVAEAHSLPSRPAPKLSGEHKLTLGEAFQQTRKATR